MKLWRKTADLLADLEYERARADAAESRVGELEALVRAESEPVLHCSFCGKSQHKVARLVAGPTTFICNECIVLCVEICIDPDGFKGKPKRTRRTPATGEAA